MVTDTDRFSLLIQKLNEVEPKLDGLTGLLEKLVRDEVDRQMKIRDEAAGGGGNDAAV